MGFRRYVSSGQTVSGVQIGFKDVVVVESGGRLISSIVSDRGSELIEDGGFAEGDRILASGNLTISAGGSAEDETVSASGRVYLYGGQLTSSILEPGALLYAYGAILSDVTVSSGALARLYDVMISGGETLVLEPKSEPAVYGGLIAASGGKVLYVDPTVDSGGVLSVAAGANVSGVIVHKGGVVTGAGALIESRDAGLVSGLRVADLTISSGGSAVHDTVLGYEVVAAGAQTSGEILQSGPPHYPYEIGSQAVYGLAISTTVVDGAQVVSSGGAASATIVGSKELQEIEVGGLASGVTVRAGGSALDEGSATAVKVLGAGAFDLNGLASEVVVSSGGLLLDDGVASDVRVLRGGVVSVGAGAALSGVTISGGGLVVAFNDADVEGVTLRAGATLIHDYAINYGAFSGAVVSSGAYLIARDEAEADQTVVSSGGVAYDESLLSATAVSAGGEEIVYAGATDIGGTLVGVAGGDPPASGRIGLETGLERVSGVVSGATVSSGGYLKLEAGDAISNGQIESGGAAYSATVLDGGVLEVDSAASLNGATIGSGGELLIYDRYHAVGGLTLAAGAVIALGDQAATAARFSGGALVVSSGGHAIESFAVSGSTSGLAVSVTQEADGQTLLTITSAPGSAATPRSLVEAAAGFAGGGSVPLTPASGTAPDARLAGLAGPPAFAERRTQAV